MHNHDKEHRSRVDDFKRRVNASVRSMVDGATESARTAGLRAVRLTARMLLATMQEELRHFGNEEQLYERAVIAIAESHLARLGFKYARGPDGESLDVRIAPEETIEHRLGRIDEQLATLLTMLNHVTDTLAIIASATVPAPGNFVREERTRRDVHGGNPHDECYAPMLCICECLVCKRVWEAAGRPQP